MRSFAPTAIATCAALSLFAASAHAEPAVDGEPTPPKPPSDQPPTPVPAATPTPPPAPPLAPVPGARSGRFQFGSYGRVMGAIDGRGGPGRNADIVTHGSRLDESTYVELELRREDQWDLPGDTSAVTTKVVTTVAIGDPLFHSSGKFEAKLAVRNLYLEERGIGGDGISVWVGSRMYRGDDAYLLDWWPLDNLNTVGGGVKLALPTKTELALHVGTNRLDDPFQYQTSPRPLPYTVGTTDVAILNRARVIESARLEQLIPGALFDKGGLKFVAYGELHQLAAGQRETQPGSYQDVPSDHGYVAGLQLGAYSGDHDGHVNVFLRYATGIAAYGGDFSVPYAVAADHSAKTAHEAIVAVSGNYETGPFALMAAGYFRSFRAATAEAFSFYDVDEGIIVLRPHVWFGERAGVAVEGSYQRQQHGIIDPATEAPLTGSLWRFGVMPFLSPAGRGTYRRPQLRAIWVLTQRDDGAKKLYPIDDPFARRSTEQFVGLEAEWWFNSSYRLVAPIDPLMTPRPLRPLRPLIFAFAAALASSCMTLKDAQKPDLQPHVKDWREEIIYQVLVDRFANGDAANDFNVKPGVPARYHGGDWKGLEDKLEYIQALGVTTLWISPIIKNVETDAGVDGYHGYWAQDLTQLNPHFGEIGSLRRLVRACHQIGMKVIVDIVTNHLGQMFYYDINQNGQPDTQLSNSGERFDGKGNLVPVHYQTEYDPDFDPRGVQSRTSLGESGLAPAVFVYDPAANKMPVWAFGSYPDIFQQARAYHRKGRVVDFGATTKVCQSDSALSCDKCPNDGCVDYFYQTELGDFPGGLKDVATELPEVRDAMIESYLHWVVETDIDGFRIDTLKHVEHGFWQTFAPAIRKRLTAAGKVNFLMFGESFDGDDHKNGSYTQKGELDSVFYFAQKFQVFDDVVKNHGPTSKIKSLWDSRAANYGPEAQENGVVIPPAKLLVSFLDNHDVPRFLYGQTDTLALHAALILLFTEDGIPCLYYGTEQDYAGGNDPANREDLWTSGYQTTGDTFRLVSFLTGLRRSRAAFTKGDQKVLFTTEHTEGEPDAGLFAFSRGGGDAGDSKAIVVLNTNPGHQSQATIPTDFAAGSVLVDKLHNDAQVTVGAGGGLDVVIDPMQGAILVPQGQ